jgi:hypothetical protein
MGTEFRKKANESSDMSEELKPVTWCTECGSGLTKDRYCTACLMEEIETLRKVEDSLRAELEAAKEEIAELKRFRELAFDAHPNIDIDVKLAAQTEGER